MIIILQILIRINAVLTKFKTKFEHLDSLMRKEYTGSADEFAQKLEISERTLQNHLQQIRGLGIDVIYDHYKRTYIYTQKDKIYFYFTPKKTYNIKSGAWCNTSSTSCLELLLL